MNEIVNCPSCGKPMLRGKTDSVKMFESIYWVEDGKSTWNPKNRVPINLSETRAYYCKECFVTAIYEFGDKNDQIPNEVESDRRQNLERESQEEGMSHE